MKEILKQMGRVGMATGEMLLDDAVRNIRLGVEYLSREEREIAFGNLDDIVTDDLNTFNLDGRNHADVTNITLFSGTGGGKTAVGLLPFLFRANGPIIFVHDPSETVYPLTAPRFYKLGYQIHNFNYSKLLYSTSHNIIDEMVSDEDCNRISSHMLNSSQGGSKSDIFFILSGASLLAFLFKINLRMDAKYRNMANIRHMLNGLIGGGLHRIVAKYATDSFFAEYRAILSNGSDKTLGSIVMTVQASLEYWTSSAMCRATAVSSIDFEGLRYAKKPSIIYFSTSTFDSGYYRNLTSLTLDLAMRALMRSVPKDARSTRKVFFLIDEANTLRLPSLSEVISNTRKYFIYNMLMYQNRSQLEVYGKDMQNILANSSSLYYGHQDLQTSRELSELFGKRNITGRDGRSKMQYLMDAQDIVRMPKEQGLFVHHNIPYRLNLVPWFRQSFLKLETKYPPYVFNNDLIPSTVPLIPLEYAKKKQSDVGVS